MKKSHIHLKSPGTRNDKQQKQKYASEYVLSQAIHFGRQCHFKIWLDCHKFENFPCLIMPISAKCQKNENKNDN
jgi:hypothetical protein